METYPPRPPPLSKPEYLRQYWPGIMLAAGVVGWFAAIEWVYGLRSINSPPVTPSVLLLYVSIIAIGVAITEIVRRKRPWRWTQLTGRLLTTAVVFIWGYYDRRESEFQREDVRYT